MGVAAVVGSGRLGLGGFIGESSIRVRRREGAMQGGGNGTGRDNGPGMRAGRTKK